jgi:hypothetical protein
MARSTSLSVDPNRSPITLMACLMAVVIFTICSSDVIKRLPLEGLRGAPAQKEFLRVRPVARWITNNTIPIKNRIQDISVATAATPATFRAPAITPTTKNANA